MLTEVLIAIFLTLIAAGGWFASLLGLPGNWAIVVLGALCWWLPEPSTRLAVGGAALAWMTVFALVGEALEFFAGALGVQRLGGGKRSAALALMGSIVGAIAGFALGSGVPVIGNVIASLVGSALGALAGSVVGERWLGRPWEHSLQVGSAAFYGRLLGTLAKAMCGAVVVSIFLIAIWF